jgi:hypothetical protein
MTVTLPGLLALIRQTIADPRGVAAAIIAWGLPREVLWPALALTVTLGVLMGALMPPGAGLPFSPFMTWMITAASLVTLVFALFWTGRALGGRGSFEGTLAVITWLEVVELAVRAVLIALLWLFGAVAQGPVTLIGAAVVLWLMIHFIDVLHGYGSLWRSLLTLGLALLGLGAGLGLIVGLIGGLAGV